MQKITVIVCNNGLGHAKRVLYLLKLLYSVSALKLRANVFLNRNNIRYFPELRGFLNRQRFRINLIHADYDHLEYENIFLSRHRKYLDDCDYIWSDNLVFPLKYKKKVFLTGSFLWSDVVQNRDFIKNEEGILLGNRPSAIGSKYFSTPRIKTLTRFSGVGIYNYLRFGLSGKNRYSVLLACGRSSTGREVFLENIIPLQDAIAGLHKKFNIYIEPDFRLLFGKSGNIREAKFDNQMYARISAAVIRPGLGSICDALIKGARIFSFYESGNPEMIHNSKVLSSLGVGECGCTPVKALSLALKYLADEKEKRRHALRLSGLDFNGLNETAGKIQELLN